jgi:hypothetical protein
VVKGFVWFTHGSGTTKETGAGVCGKKAQYLSRKVFKAEVYAILVCVYEIQTNVRLEKCDGRRTNCGQT